jgi:hypothetical protein
MTVLHRHTHEKKTSLFDVHIEAYDTHKKNY